MPHLTRIRISPLILTVLLYGCTASAETSKMTDKSAHPVDAACDMRFDFSDANEISKWRIVLDGVMGGRSSGVHLAAERHMSFKGVINTNGGGFSSLRRSTAPGEMANAQNIGLKLRQDGRAYRLSFRTNERYRGRLVSYQLAIPQTPKGEWAEVSIPLSGFRTSLFGREISAARFNPAQVSEIGIIIADGIDGSFRIDVKTVWCQ